MEILTSRPPEMPMAEYKAILKLQQQSIKTHKLGKFVHESSEVILNSVGKVIGVRKNSTPFTGPVFKEEL